MWLRIVGGIVAVIVLIAFGSWLASPSGVEREAKRLFGDGPVGPHTKKALELAAAVRDRHQAADVTNTAVASQLPCGVAALNAFDASTGKPRYWAYRWPDGSLECFNTSGFHRITRAPLLELDTDAVRSILGNPQKYPPEGNGLWGPPAPRPASAPMASAPRPARASTPLPDLSQGPCCPK